MTPAVAETLLLFVALLSIAVLLRRLRAVERERAGFARRLADRDATEGDAESTAAVRALVADLGHALATPLTVILGQCELAAARGEETRRLAIVEEQARRILAVADRCRSAGAASHEGVRMVDPELCLRGVLDDLAPVAAARDVRIHEILEPVPGVAVDDTVLTVVLRLLVRAAVQAAPPGRGDVTVALGTLPADGLPAHVAFAVADDGPGGDAGSPLRIATTLAEALGAAVVVDTTPGAGTRATLKVPLGRPAPPGAKGKARPRGRALERLMGIEPT